MTRHVSLLAGLLLLVTGGPAAAQPRAVLESGPVQGVVNEALRRRSSAPLRALIERRIRGKLDRALRDIRQLDDHPEGDLAAERLHLHAYAALVHFMEVLVAAAEMPVREDAEPESRTGDQLCLCDCPECPSDRDCLPCACLCTGVEDTVSPFGEDSPTSLRSRREQR